MQPPKPAPRDGDPVDALELLSGAAADPVELSSGSASPRGAPRGAVAGLSAPIHAPAGPRWRCLDCGYPIIESLEPTCSECGRRWERGVLERWASGAEDARLERAAWFVLAALFAHLFALPMFLTVARIASACFLFAACQTALVGRQDSIGGYLAISGMAAAALMIVPFAWMGNALPYYTLHLVATSALVLAMLHDPVASVVGRSLGGRQIAPFVLFGAPVLATVCYVLDAVEAAPAVTIPVGGSSYDYAPFSFILPYLVALGWGVFAWQTLVAARKRLCGPPEE